MIQVYAHFDLRVTALPPTGVCKHIHQMVTGLARETDFNLSLLASRDQVASADLLAKNPLKNASIYTHPIAHRLSRHVWEHSELWPVDRYCPTDGWIYCPMTISVPVKKMRQVSTFHGYPCFERGIPGYDSWARRILRYRSQLQAQKAVDRCRFVLAVSEYAKDELISLTGVEPHRVKIVGNGVEPLFFAAGEQSSMAEVVRPYFLTVGGLNVWDGGEYLLGAARELARCAPEYRLLVAGNQHDPQYLKRAEEFPNLELLGYIPAPRLVEIMRSARGLLFLPNVESFGITALEAMAVGIPVVSSRLTGVPATVGQAALMVDVTNSEEVVTAALSISESSSLRSELIALGRQRAAKFTWQACVQRLATVVREADS